MHFEYSSLDRPINQQELPRPFRTHSDILLDHVLLHFTFVIMVQVYRTLDSCGNHHHDDPLIISNVQQTLSPALFGDRPLIHPNQTTFDENYSLISRKKTTIKTETDDFNLNRLLLLMPSCVFDTWPKKNQRERENRNDRLKRLFLLSRS